MSSGAELRGRALWEARIRERSKWAVREGRWKARVLTARWRALPDFLVVGAAKAGTTSLFAYLVAHPLVCAPVDKELRYFAYHYEQGTNWYRAHFPLQAELARTGRRHGGPAQTGEASPGYLTHPQAAVRAHALVPRARIVVVLRDPVDRAISAYHFAVRHGRDDRTLEEAIAGNLRNAGTPYTLAEHDDIHHPLRLNSYVERGHYAEGLRRWFDAYGRAQVLVLPTEALTRTGGDGFARVLEFLGLPEWTPPTFDEHNVGTYASAPEAVRADLGRYFAPLNADLWELLGEDWGWNTRAAYTRERA